MQIHGRSIFFTVLAIAVLAVIIPILRESRANTELTSLEKACTSVAKLAMNLSNNTHVGQASELTEKIDTYNIGRLRVRTISRGNSISLTCRCKTVACRFNRRVSGTIEDPRCKHIGQKLT